ncbi:MULTISPECIES: rhodanese-like domain-containing protein [Pseudomonas]|uniref:rhodanese-like domain-containing protein n=1 Tax=Pseudomonas TaxID=286 RepID=UPI002306143A|nr:MULTISPECIES: rhodanese-like domain-containing protein [unclassified Pseudomonas]MDU9414035.1 rhodanese-like domain-containing protein [Pseudomonas sp. zfem005]WCD78849.1 rhodanese-like domain-containing protein [Pseudomonas sp. TUM22785]
MNDTIRLIDAPRFAELHQRGAARFLIDVRSPAEYRAGHIAGAHNEPLGNLDPVRLAERLRGEGLNSGDELYLICQKGQRARQAAERLSALLPGVQVIEGGTDACLACGMPREGSGGGLELQRQVQISAGSLVLLGVVLGTWVHPGWYLLSGFVGAGLTFAGLSGTCGLALVLARMPWNR